MRIRRNQKPPATPITYSVGRPPQAPRPTRRRTWLPHNKIDTCTNAAGAAIIVRIATGLPGLPGFALALSAFLIWPWFVPAAVQAARAAFGIARSGVRSAICWHRPARSVLRLGYRPTLRRRCEL